MQRLTTQQENGTITVKEKFNQHALCVLADYEDTGLTPREIRQMKARCERLDAKSSRLEKRRTKILY